MSDKKIYPAFENTFEAFHKCKYEKLSVIIIGQDPYFDGSATGIAFANTREKNPVSPSLEVIKKAVYRHEGKEYDSTPFDNTLLSWASQGVLLLNSSLSVEAGKPGSHYSIWLPFMQKFIKNLGEWQTGIIYVLMGSQAKALKPFIGKYNDIIECAHPAYYARNKEPMPDIFEEIDNLTMGKNGFKIKWL